MRQITVITEDHVGLIAKISALLAEAGLNIHAIEARQVAAKACIRLDVENMDTAMAALQKAGIRAIAEDVILLRMADQPGALADLSQRLAEADIDIRSLTMLHRDQGESIVALACDHSEQARQLLAQWALH